MKNIYIIQNSNLSFDMDISKIYSSKKYRLFLIVNKFRYEKLKQRKQDFFFVKIWQVDNFELTHLKEIISLNQQEYASDLQIVTNAEESIIVCGNLRLHFKIDEMNYDRFKNKIEMKKLLRQQGILVPNHMVFDKTAYLLHSRQYIDVLTKMLRFPLIAKPIDGMGCMGIKKILSIAELTNWCIEAIKSDDIYEIDEFIEGKVYNCDSFIKDSKIIFTQVSECSNSCYDFICGFTKGTLALSYEDEIYNKLINYTKMAHQALKTPKGGVTHLEVIKTKDDTIYFIEIGHRSPGILIPAMYRIYLGIETIESHVLLQINNEYKFNIKYGPYCAWIAFPTKCGKLITKHEPGIFSQYQIDWAINTGDIMSNPTCGRDYAGRVLLWNDDYQQLKTDFYYLNSPRFFL